MKTPAAILAALFAAALSTSWANDPAPKEKAPALAAGFKWPNDENSDQLELRTLGAEVGLRWTPTRSESPVKRRTYYTKPGSKFGHGDRFLLKAIGEDSTVKVLDSATGKVHTLKHRTPLRLPWKRH